jgi:serine/threonine protein kinase
MSHDQLNALPKGYELHGYRIESILGSGGFGITYRAREVSIDRVVAIKEYLPAGVAVRGHDRSSIHPVSASDQSTFEWGLDRFRHEAQTLVAFRHPNIVTVLRFFEANGTAYMVMGYEEGESLEQILERDGTIDEAAIRAFLDPLLDGLEEVHKIGFLHRDIKPGNIYLRNDGTPVLLDFGAARQALGVRSHSLTAIVTAGYAPHEQYECDSAQGPWTDIYAMGAVLYRAISGEIPPEATMRLSAYARDRSDPMTPASEIGLGRYSLALLDSIDGALRIMEHDRPQTISEWRDWLAGASTSRALVSPLTVVPLDSYRPVPPRPPSRSGRKALVAAMAVLLVSGAAGAGYVAYQEITSERATYRRAVERHRLSASAAKREADAFAKRYANEEKRRRAEAAARKKAEEAVKRKAEEETKRVAELSRQLEAERRKTELAKRRANAEARRRTAADATRSVEDQERARAAAVRRKDLEAERRKAAETRQRLKAQLKEARDAQRKIQDELRQVREDAKRREARDAKRLKEMELALRTAASGEGVRREKKGRSEQPQHKAKTPTRKNAKGSAAKPIKDSKRTPRLDGLSEGKPREVASLMQRPPAVSDGVQRIYGRWCGEMGALHFTPTHMATTSYESGTRGRYELLNYLVRGGNVVVQFAMPDGLHRIAFGRFSDDNDQMIEVARKRPGFPWRRMMLPWHRC